jgi:hypothetical protein
MCMGVITPPNLEQRFDGSITIERISKKMKLTKQRYYNKQFVDNYLLNEQLINGIWRD